jgi:uncharacterized protein (TIGR03066 family)
MKLTRTLLACLLVLGFAAVCSSARAAEKKPIDKEKLVGTWETIKKGTLPLGSTLEIGKDGKMKLTVKGGAADKSDLALEGNYALEGDVLKATLKFMGREMVEKLKLEMPSDDMLITTDEKGGVDTFRRKR